MPVPVRREAWEDWCTDHSLPFVRSIRWVLWANRGTARRAPVALRNVLVVRLGARVSAAVCGWCIDV